MPALHEYARQLRDDLPKEVYRPVHSRLIWLPVRLAIIGAASMVILREGSGAVASRFVSPTNVNRDGELLNQAAARLGWRMIRGSTSRGSVSALKQLLRVKEHHLNVAPDEPRGPRRQMAQGAVFVAAKAGLPIVCCSYGFVRPWRLNSWDRCIIPRPFSRAPAILGPPLTVPNRLDRAGMEHYRRVIEQLLNRQTLEAESWAESHEKKLREFALHPRRLFDALARWPRMFQTPLSDAASSIVNSLRCPNSVEIRSRRAA